MSGVTAEMVKDLRACTGAGVLDCRKALEEAAGDTAKATELLRKRGLAQAAKKESRAVNEGLIGHYVHAGARVAALIEINCESDFVARTDALQNLAHDLAMQVVAANPLYVKPEAVPAEVLEQERAKYRAQLEGSGKPAEVVEKIIEGKLNKFFEETCLVNQPFIKDGDSTVGDVVKQTIAKTGENIVVRRFVRFALGE